MNVRLEEEWWNWRDGTVVVMVEVKIEIENGGAVMEGAVRKRNSLIAYRFSGSRRCHSAFH